MRLRKTGRYAGTNDGIKVVATIPLLRNMVERIGGGEVQVDTIIHGTACAHAFEPTGGEMAKIARCDLAVRVGLGFDSWFDRLISCGAKSMVVVDTAEGVRAIMDGGQGHEHSEEGEDHEDSVENHEDEEEKETADGVGHHHHQLENPHYFSDPDNAKLMATNIMEGLSKVRPSKRRFFIANCEQFKAEIKEQARELRAEVAALTDKRVVSYSAAFPYFFGYFGFQNLATIETACEQEISPKRLLEAAKLIQAKKVRVIVGESVSPTLPEKLARDVGITVVLLWPASNESGDYLQTMRENVNALLAALR